MEASVVDSETWSEQEANFKTFDALRILDQNEGYPR